MGYSMGFRVVHSDFHMGVDWLVILDKSGKLYMYINLYNVNKSYIYQPLM